LVVVVDCDREVQLQRLRSRNGLTEAEAAARLAAQSTRAERLAAADIVIDNSGTVEELAARSADLWDELTGGGGAPGV
ncbi:MAG TPA: dephospho-CoA kinase, partial [Propionibacteriaceae bacterium]